jgi:DNA-binding LytR/AlgR family response regulator
MLNIAIVDDNQDDRTRLSTYVSEYLNLIGEKFTLSLYERGLNFLDDFKKLFNVVFLDIEMPVMNGLEVSKKLRELDANVSIIFVTNFGSLAINGYDVQALDFLVKPVKSLDVKECLKKVMAN